MTKHRRKIYKGCCGVCGRYTCNGRKSTTFRQTSRGSGLVRRFSVRALIEENLS